METAFVARGRSQRGSSHAKRAARSPPVPKVPSPSPRFWILFAEPASGGNRVQAAERLGIRRQLLYQRPTRHGLDLSLIGTDSVSEADSADSGGIS